MEQNYVGDVGTIELVGVVGSQAYGLATPESDVDLMGMFTSPISDLLAGAGHDTTITRTKRDGGDGAFHELTKMVRLVVGGNSTVTELLWLPSYEVCSPVGQVLVDNRETFLSLRFVSACVGYAAQQLKTIPNSKGPVSRPKQARHAMRLLVSADSYLDTGTVTPMLTADQLEQVRSVERLTLTELTDRFDGMVEAVTVKRKKSSFLHAPDGAAVRAVVNTCRAMQIARDGL